MYAAGSQVAFLHIHEKVDKEMQNKTVQLTRKVGGGAAAPRQRAFGGVTKAPNMSKVMTSTQ